MFDKLHELKERFYYLEEKLSDPEIISDMKQFTKINKDYKELKDIVDLIDQREALINNIDTAKEMMNEEDEEMREMAKEELEVYQQDLEKLDEELKFMLIPKDPEDTKDVLFEIRSGAGGDEASIFAGDLYRMYTKYFETKSYKVEVLEVNEGTAGGYNKIVLEVSGDNVYGQLKFESGAHRVQRVPKTESQGRVHTSAATVVVMPKLELEDVDIRKEDLKVDTFRSSGAGGQHVNKTESGVRFTHLPTGIVAESTDGRSQIKNREIALNRLAAKIRDEQQQKHHSEQAAKRRSLVGSGDRSDKIRTYNFPQNRVTDHRINLTVYNLDAVMNGELDEFIEKLHLAENTEKLKEAGAPQ